MDVNCIDGGSVPNGILDFIEDKIRRGILEGHWDNFGWDSKIWEYPNEKVPGILEVDLELPNRKNPQITWWELLPPEPEYSD